MSTDLTSDRILAAALGLFARQGVKKTDLAAVAYEAGVTRVTIYRYFGDKQGLVRAVCAKIAGVFQRAGEAGPQDSVREVDDRLIRLADELGGLPQGEWLVRLEEISRLYPAVYSEFRAVREAAVDRLLHQSLEAARRSGSLREDLHPEVLRAVFRSSVIGLIENPALIDAKVSLPEVLTTVCEIFRHGVLVSSSCEAKDQSAGGRADGNRPEK